MYEQSSAGKRLALFAALAVFATLGAAGAGAAPLPTVAKAPAIESSTAAETVAMRRGGQRARVVVVRPRRVVRVVRRPIIVRPAVSRVVVVGDRCAYYRNRWRATGSAYWLRRLRLCQAGVI